MIRLIPSTVKANEGLYDFLFGIWFRMECEIYMPTAVHIHKQNKNIITHGISNVQSRTSVLYKINLYKMRFNFARDFVLSVMGFLQTKYEIMIWYVVLYTVSNGLICTVTSLNIIVTQLHRQFISAGTYIPCCMAPD